MNSPLDVEWTNRSLKNAQNIRQYLASEFSSKDIHDFEDLLKHFEDTVSKNLSCFKEISFVEEGRASQTYVRFLYGKK